MPITQQSVLNVTRPVGTPDIPHNNIPETQLDSLVRDMNAVGYAVIANYMTPAQITRMRTFVTTAIAESGHSYLGFVGKQAVEGSIFAELSDAPEFRELLQRVLDRGAKRIPKREPYQVLRCLAGAGAAAHSLIFHYDSYLVTLLIPVIIPTEGQTGDLIMLPNMRRVRSHYALNLLDKLMLDNKVTQWLLRKLHNTKLLPVVRIKMEPGNAYLFWGYRSVHANEACEPTEIRATAIYHLGNPHADSNLGATVRAWFPR